MTIALRITFVLSSEYWAPIDGADVKIKDMLWRKLVFNFWATMYASCKEKKRGLVSIQER